MSHVTVRGERLDLQDPVFIEGLPGLGLVGKIAADHLVEQFGMTYYASIECPSLPSVAAYREGAHESLPAVRIYADEARDLLALESDVAVSPRVVSDFASCLTSFVVDVGAVPLYSSGLAHPDGADPDGHRSLYGISTGGGSRILRDLDVEPPSEAGVWWGPTGALLDTARMQGLTSVGLVVEADPQFPDPEAACALIERGIEPLAGVDVDVGALRARADAIREERRQLAEEMQVSEGNESSKALRMYQ